MGRQRKVVLTVPQFSALPALLAGSDMLAVVPDYVALAMVRREGLRAQFAPLELPEHDLTMVWRGTSHDAPGERWLRSRLSFHLCQQREWPRAVA
ncbi:hypothetical protein D9M68_991300 [compost metagenome]